MFLDVFVKEMHVSLCCNFNKKLLSHKWNKYDESLKDLSFKTFVHFPTRFILWRRGGLLGLPPLLDFKYLVHKLLRLEKNKINSESCNRRCFRFFLLL